MLLIAGNQKIQKQPKPKKREEGAIEATIKTAREFNTSNQVIIDKLMSNFDLTKSEADEKLEEYEKTLQFV